MLKRLAVVGAVAGSAIAIAAGPALASYNPTITTIGSTVKVKSAGAFVGVKVSYRCDPTSSQTELDVTFRQAIHGSVYSATKYFHSSLSCSGSVTTETVRVFQDNGEPAWHTGSGTVTAQAVSYYDNGGSRYGPSKSRSVRAIR